MPLHEQPRRIAHQAQTRTLAVLTEIPGYTIGADEPDKCSLRLLDDQVNAYPVAWYRALATAETLSSTGITFCPDALIQILPS